MANKNILTYGAKVSNVELVTYTPVAVRAPFYDTPSATLYSFLAKVVPWDDDNNPPQPTQDQKSIKKTFKNIFAVKKITSNDISPVIARVDWTSGVVYNYYTDDGDIFEKDDNGNNIYNFYVKNRYDQVFKCLWNANGLPSTVEPFFEPGSYTPNNVYFGADGYKWKYVYTIDVGLKVRFMDQTWMPVPIGIGYIPNPLLNPNNLPTPAGIGNIDVINVTEGGDNYDTSNAIVYITITGDGTGAAASAVVANGRIQDIVVTNPGTNYSYANVSIVSALGSGATAIAPAASAVVASTVFDMFAFFT